DMNDQIEDGDTFTGWGGTHQRWMEYAKKALGDSASDEEESPTNTNSNSDSSPVEKKKQAKEGKKCKVDAVSMVSHIGKVWIGDIKDSSLDEFITFHYSKASGMKDGSVLWVQISTQRLDYISVQYLPQGAKLQEPSKLQKKEVISLLEFWRDRQRSNPANVFTFRKWRDAKGTLQDPVVIYHVLTSQLCSSGSLLQTNSTFLTLLSLLFRSSAFLLITSPLFCLSLLPLIPVPCSSSFPLDRHLTYLMIPPSN
ncbi:hypothetical protein PAXRUDRAFT_177668, partial [Paxillus rubicundulus Ve08.2h10]